MTTPPKTVEEILLRFKNGCPVDVHDDAECGLTTRDARLALKKLLLDAVGDKISCEDSRTKVKSIIEEIFQ